jgi:urease accessory protein
MFSGDSQAMGRVGENWLRVIQTADAMKKARDKLPEDASGELFEFDLYSSTLTASRPGGAPLFTEKLVAEPWRHPVRQAGAMGRYDVLANVTVVTPPQRAWQIFEQVVPGADIGADCVAGASRLPSDAGLVYKVLGMETEPVKAKVREFWGLVRQEVTGAPIPAARAWGSPL